jgi:hypothetical protein
MQLPNKAFALRKIGFEPIGFWPEMDDQHHQQMSGISSVKFGWTMIYIAYVFTCNILVATIIEKIQIGGDGM